MLCPGLPRTKTIRTETICEVYSLTYHDFHQMLELFPKFSKHMRQLAVERGLSEQMLVSLPKLQKDVSETNLDAKAADQEEQMTEAIYTMNRLDRQLVAIADTLRTLHRRT
jgi:CRP-like cAMP-binding protein